MFIGVLQQYSVFLSHSRLHATARLTRNERARNATRDIYLKFLLKLNPYQRDRWVVLKNSCQVSQTASVHACNIELELAAQI